MSPRSAGLSNASMPRWAQAITWAAAGLAIALPPLVTVTMLGTTAPDVAELVLGLVLSSSAVVGALIVTRIPGNSVGWLLLAAGVMFGVNLASQTWVETSIADFDGTLPLTAALAWFTSWSFVVAIALIGVYVPLLFPDGRLPSRRLRWKVYLVVATAGLVVSQAPIMFGSGPLMDYPSLMNPFGFLDVTSDLVLLDSLNVASVVLAFPIALAAPVIRFRRAQAVERQQLKWFGSVGIATGLMLIPLFVLPDLGWDLFWILFLFGLALMPVAIGIAILRYRLYDIDRLVSRSIAYALVTGGLIVVYVLVNLGLTTVFGSLTRADPIAVAASTLTVAALFTPVRRRVQAVVDRRFDRARYDADLTAVAFAARLRDEVNLPDVTADLDATVRRAIAPVALDVWLRGSRT